MNKYLLFSTMVFFYHGIINSMQVQRLARLTPAASQSLKQVRQSIYRNPQVMSPYRSLASTALANPQVPNPQSQKKSTAFYKSWAIGTGIAAAALGKTAYAEQQKSESTIFQKFEKNLELKERIKINYGLFGLQTIEKIIELLNEIVPNSEIIYHESRRLFEITNSSAIDPKMLKEALDKLHYTGFDLLEGWQPEVEKKKNPKDNLTIKLVIAKKKLDYADLLPKDIHQPLPNLPHEYYSHNEIIEALQSEAVFTTASDSKPIAATYGAGPCIAVAGWDPTNKVAFVVHFATAKEVEVFQNQLLQNIIGLSQEQPKQPLELHLRGGIEGTSEDTVNAITQWVKNLRYPIVIRSASILKYGYGSESIAIDARTGKVYDYQPLKNPHHRKMTELDALKAQMSAFNPNITVAYKAQKS